jgi:hypothetical protein
MLLDSYTLRDLRTWLRTIAAKSFKRLQFERTMLKANRALWTSAGRRFVEVDLLVQGYLHKRLKQNPGCGPTMASQLLNVLKHCDTITYEEPGTAEAYGLLHFLDRYHRFQVTYSHLNRNGLMLTKPSGIDVLDVGTGPGPSIFAVSDFFRERLGLPSEPRPGQHRPKFTIDYVEQSTEFRIWLHWFTEHANYYAPTSRQWYVPYHAGTFHDFRGITFDEQLSYWEPDDDGEGEYVRYTRRHRYESNFLTTRDQVIRFKEELQSCARFLRNRGILLVVGAKDLASKYKQVYQAISDVVLGANYGNSKFIAWSERVELEPRVLSYRWNDPYGELLKKQLQSVYEVLHSRHAELIPPAAARKLEASMKPSYDKPIEWQIMIFRKHARPRGPRRASVDRVT